LASSCSTSRIERVGFPYLEYSRNSVPIAGELSKEAYSLKLRVGSGVEGALALRVKPPTACLIDSIVWVAAVVEVATGAMLIPVSIVRYGWGYYEGKAGLYHCYRFFISGGGGEGG
jgi:hypothetical protein